MFHQRNGHIPLATIVAYGCLYGQLGKGTQGSGWDQNVGHQGSGFGDDSHQSGISMLFTLISWLFHPFLSTSNIPMFLHPF